MSNSDTITNHELISLTADIVSAHVSNNSVPVNDISGLIQSVHAAFVSIDQAAQVKQPKQEPAVSIRSSVKNDYIVCLEDGAKLKMLKRYLRTRFDMSPEEYRAKWDLPRDYPMVAPAYAERRKELAVKIGLGRKSTSEIAVAGTEATKPKRARPKAPKSETV